MMAKKAIEKYGLILMNGKMVDVFIPEDETKTVFKELLECMETEKVWDCGGWLKVKVIFGGERFEFVDFKKVVGLKY